MYFDWTFTPAEGYEEYAAVTDIVKVPVAPKSINGATITLEKYEFQYNATEQSPKITGVTLDNWDETRITYVIKSGDKATDVSDRITLTIEGTGNYTGKATVEWKITPREVTPTIEVASCTYTGDALEPTVTVKDDIGNIIDQKEYEIFYSNNTNAGIATVTIKDVEGGNYVLSGASKTFEITKAAAPTMQPIELTVINGLAKTYLVNLPALPTLGDNCKYGSIKYEACNFDLIGEGGYANSTAMITSNDEFQLTVPAVESQTEGSVGTVGVKITTDNYQDMLLTVEVIAKNKIVPVLDGEITATPITFGQILRVSTITGTMKDDGKTVEGTFEWTNPSTKPDKAGDYQAEWTFTPAAGYEKYATATGTVTIKVNKATPTFTAPTAQENLTYTGQEQALITAGSVTSGGTMQYSLTENGTYSQDIPTGTDAGAYTVWYRVIGDANHNDTAPASVAVRIGKKPLTITGVTAASKPYDGTTNADISSVTFDNVTLNRGTDYTVTANFDDASVDSGKNITATVTLMEQAAKNYALEQSSFPTTGSIIKAAAPDFTKETALTIVNGHEKTYTVTLPALPTLETPKEYGAPTYEIGEIKLNDGYYTSGAKVENGELTLPIQKNDVETTGSVGTVTVVIKSANYEDITLTVNVSAKNRITPIGTPTLSKNAIIYGDALNTIALSGKLHDNVNNVDVDGTFEWVDGTHIPVVGNGTYAAEWIFEPTDTEKYLTVSGRSNITVEKARQYGKLSMAGYTYGKTPSTPTLTDQTGDLNAQVTYSYAAADSGSVQTWDISNPPALNAGTYRMYASIGDTDNYYGFEAVYCEFVVAKATPTYTVPTGLTAKYGQTLADVTLPDGWSWMDSSESVGGASTAAKTFQAKFTPKDTENYNTVENIELEVTVNKADGGNLKTVELEQKYTDASDHTYTPDWAGLPAGQDWTFSSEASIVLSKQDFAANGSLLTYAISGGKAGDKITLILKASCDNYEDFTITLNVTLTEKDDQKPLTITGNTSVIYGEKLTLTTTGGSGTGAVTYRIDNAISTGEATIDPNTGVLTPVKVGSVSVIATKAGDNNYNDVTSAPFVLMIKPATPTGEPKYTKITTSGKTLKDVTLTIEGSTLNPSDGKLEWVDDKGEPLPDDTTVKANTTYKWRFTPDDDNYTTLTGEVELYHKSSSGGGWYNSYYTIKATAGAGGSISPSGNVSVREDSNSFADCIS
ncbi:MAG: YDG domain-containing protein [Lachnospiraceae bacterium]